jgi:hypothetical protein
LGALAWPQVVVGVERQCEISTAFETIGNQSPTAPVAKDPTPLEGKEDGEREIVSIALHAH